MPRYNIQVQFEHKILSFLCPEAKDIIATATVNEIDSPNGCCAGVYTSYDSMILEGSIDQEDAIGLNDDFREKGVALLCMAYPKSDLHVVIDDQVKNDLYNNQFGQCYK